MTDILHRETKLTPIFLVPEIAIEWAICYHENTNASLATLSNVSKLWRKVVYRVIEKMLLNYNENRKRRLHNSILENNMETETMNKFENERFFVLSELLLPDMALEMLRRKYSAHQLNPKFEDSESEIKPEKCGNMSPNSSSKFCLAWFPPQGIQFQAVKAGSQDSDDNSSADGDAIPNYICKPDDRTKEERNEEYLKFTPSGAASYEGSEDDAEKLRRNINGISSDRRFGILGGSKSTSNPKEFSQGNKNSEIRLKTCSHEWRGFHDAIDVLIPFHYSTVFVKEILDIALNILSTEDHITIANEKRTSEITDKSTKTSSKFSKCNETLSSYAVRGTTLARPDGFCLCWDKLDFKDPKELRSKSDDLDENKKKLHSYRICKLKHQKRMQRRRRKERLREYLPRMVLSNKIKSSGLQNEQGNVQGKSQRCLQFLNADGSRAVCVRTPPFACGPVYSVTMFCIGIATEDGCFVSGLRNRFELGHMHPQSKFDESNDFSAICLATDCHIDKNATKSSVLDSKNAFQNNSSHSSECDCASSESTKKSFHSSDDNSSSAESSDSRDRRDFQGEVCCSCRFKMHAFNNSNDNKNENINNWEVKEENILRGKLGPSQWHCYTAVFDGPTSLIRVDGVIEPSTKGSSTFDGKKKYENKGRIYKRMPLDGLTLGADHCFQMSLCYGDGSEGEGEGSISELAVFKGRMEIRDIMQIEQYLMKKHGIARGEDQKRVNFEENETKKSANSVKSGKIGLQKSGDRWQEDEWRRQSHALLTNPPFEVSVRGIPLRVAANHRSVAWVRTNHVTGQSIYVSRIGARQSSISSDW